MIVYSQSLASLISEEAVSASPGWSCQTSQIDCLSTTWDVGHRVHDGLDDFQASLLLSFPSGSEDCR